MKRWAALLALAAMIAGIFTGMARAADLELAAPSSILMERTTGEVLYEDNADERLRPASVTKVMTLLLVNQFDIYDLSCLARMRPEDVAADLAALKRKGYLQDR